MYELIKNIFTKDIPYQKWSEIKRHYSFILNPVIMGFNDGILTCSFSKTQIQTLYFEISRMSLPFQEKLLFDLLCQN